MVVENGDFRIFHSLFHSSEHFTYMATRQLSRDTTVDDLGDISRPLLFHIKFRINGVPHTVSYGKSYYRLLIGNGNYTLAFDWCHF